MRGCTFFPKMSPRKGVENEKKEFLYWVTFFFIEEVLYYKNDFDCDWERNGFINQKKVRKNSCKECESIWKIQLLQLFEARG